jgi:hypothetical protein
MPPKEYEGFPQTGQRCFGGGGITCAGSSWLMVLIGYKRLQASPLHLMCDAASSRAPRSKKTGREVYCPAAGLFHSSDRFIAGRNCHGRRDRRHTRPRLFRPWDEPR